MNKRDKLDKKVAILIATYNGNRYLASALNSLVNQNYSNFEVFICDDGSKEKPDSIIDSFKHLLKINYQKNLKNLGISNTYLKLINTVRSNKDIAVFFAQDDIMKENFIFETLKLFYDKKVVYVYPVLTKININGIPFKEKIVPINLQRLYGRLKPAAMMRANFITSPGSALRLSAFDDEMLSGTTNLLHDWQQSIYLAFKGKFAINYATTLFYRIHEESTSFSEKLDHKESESMVEKIQNSRHFKYFFAELSKPQKILYFRIYNKSIKIQNNLNRYKKCKISMVENHINLPAPKLLTINSKLPYFMLGRNFFHGMTNRILVFVATSKFFFKNLLWNILKTSN